MVRSELAARIAERYPHLQYDEVERAVDTVFGEIANALARGERVEFRGFGAFTVKRREARTARNPRSGEEVSVPAKFYAQFRVGKKLHERLNGGG